MVALKGQPKPLFKILQLPIDSKSMEQGLNSKVVLPKPNPIVGLLPTLNVPKFPQSAPLKTITNKMFDDKRAKGLCFWCDERFVPGNKCKKRQAFVIQLHVELVDEEMNKVMVSEAIMEKFSLIQLSLYALHGLIGFKTMRIIATHGKRQLFILVNLGSTHNFLSEYIVHKLKCQVRKVQGVQVTIANDQEL